MLGAAAPNPSEEQFFDANGPNVPLPTAPEPGPLLLGDTKEEMKTEMERMRAQMKTYERLLLDYGRSNELGRTPLVQLKMDRVELPMFDGNLTQWIAFRDQFLELVHDNKGLSPITKFYQLKSHLRGLALEAINGFKMCAADYDAAWAVLRKRYDKTDQIIDEYIRTFEQLPFMSHPNMQNLIRMVNKTNQLIRVLPALGVDVRTWDTWIIFTLKSRLDRATLKKWMDQVKLRQDVKLKELIEFLEIEAFECMPSEAEKIHSKQKVDLNKKKFTPRNAISMTVKVDSKCEYCKEPHPIYRCNKFKKLSVKDRIQAVQKAHLCIRCLRAHVDPADCTIGACFWCTKFHNSILCYKREKDLKKLPPKEKSQSAAAKVPAEKK